MHEYLHAASQMIGRESNRNNFPVLGKSRNKGRICAQKGLLPISPVLGSYYTPTLVSQMRVH